MVQLLNFKNVIEESFSSFAHLQQEEFEILQNLAIATKSQNTQENGVFPTNWDSLGNGQRPFFVNDEIKARMKDTINKMGHYCAFESKNFSIKLADKLTQETNIVWLPMRCYVGNVRNSKQINDHAYIVISSEAIKTLPNLTDTMTPIFIPKDFSSNRFNIQNLAQMKTPHPIYRDYSNSHIVKFLTSNDIIYISDQDKANAIYNNNLHNNLPFLRMPLIDDEEKTLLKMKCVLPTLYSCYHLENSKYSDKHPLTVAQQFLRSELEEMNNCKSKSQVENSLVK